METSDWLEVSWRMWDEWKCVLKGDGELYLMMDGQPLMLKLYVDNWDIVQRVSCLIHNYFCGNIKNLSFTEVSVYGRAHFGEGIGPILMSDVECRGSESRLLDCLNSEITADKSHAEDIGVHCQLG